MSYYIIADDAAHARKLLEVEVGIPLEYWPMDDARWERIDPAESVCVDLDAQRADGAWTEMRSLLGLPVGTILSFCW